MNKKSIVIAGVVLALVVLGGAASYFLTLKKDGAAEETAQNLTKDAGELRSLTKEWVDVIREKGAEQAYADFKVQAPALSLDTHDQAHAFGEALYEVEGLSGFKICDDAFDFGCYHSLFGVAVHNEGIGILPKVNQACLDKHPNIAPACQHGIGHGVLVYTDYDHLLEALELCETISDAPTGGCSSGVFMEHTFHTMETTGGKQYLRPHNGDDYEPCTSLPEKYQLSCYMEQVQWWENIYHNDYEKLGDLCKNIPGKDPGNISACFYGVGNFVADFHDWEVAPTSETCKRMPDDQSIAECHEGASWLIRYDGSGMEKASLLCEELEGTYKDACFDKLYSI
jgi:hypothetical protein